MSQTDVGRAVGASQTTVSAWENGKKIPIGDQLQALSELFNIPPIDLLDEMAQLRNNTEKALDNDPLLTREQKDALLAAYGILAKRDSLAVARSIAAHRENLPN